MFQLREKLNESLSAVIPITAIVLILSISVAPVESGVMMLFIFGALMLIFGMSLFTLGAGMSMQPMGEGIGVEVSKSRKIALSLIVCFVLGVLITVAEPDLQVLAEQIPSIPNMVLILTVAVGVGLFLTISLLRIVFGIPLARLLLIAYVIVFVLAFFVPVNFIPAAFDSGGVTTGPITVPFIMALGVGLAAIRSDRRSAEDSFGLVALCSIGPILAVLILSLFFEPNATAEEHLIPAVHTTQDAIRAFVHTLPEYAKEVMVAFAPIVCVFVLFQLISRRFRARQLLRVGLGFLYTYLGLVLFLCGANVGFMPAGQLIGGAIAGGAFRYLLVPIGMVVGYFIVAAEPAVHVLKKQVEEISNGQISQKSIGMGLSVGVSVSVGVAMFRILSGVPILPFLLFGYALSLLISFFVPPLYTGVAFDSGGVASGPMTTAFLLPFALGACTEIGGNILTDAFGIVAMVAMTPLITIQSIGLVSVIRHKKATRKAADLLSRVDDGILYFDENGENG